MIVAKEGVRIEDALRALILAQQANQSAPEETAEDALRRMGGLEKDRPSRRYILRFPWQWREKGTDRTLVGQSYLNYCNGISRPRDSQDLKLLCHIKETYDPEMEWSDYRFVEGRCRTITRIGKLSHICRIGLVEGQKRVYVDSMAEVNDRSMQEREREIRQAVKGIIETTAPEELKLKLNYLADRKLSIYAKAAKENNEAVLRAIIHSDDPMGQLQTWDRVRMMPKPFPRLSKKEGSLGTRVYHLYLSMLCGAGRRACLPFAIGMDIKNCQLAILGGVLGVREVQGFLSNPSNDFWEEITGYMGISMQHKPIIKQTIYSMCYGMGGKRLRFELEKGLNGTRPKRSFFGHPLVKATLNAVRDAQEKIVVNNGMQGAYGWIPLDGRKVNTVLSYCAQIYESDIINVLYEMAVRQEAENRAPFQILVHIHDGVMIQVYRDRDRKSVIERCQRAVAERASKYGIAARLALEEGTGTETGTEDLNLELLNPLF